MIISCPNCAKKFDVDSGLIPTKGRFLLCSSCKHKWFYKKELPKNINIQESISKEKTKLVNTNKNKKKIETIKPEKKKNINKNNRIGILNVILVFLISFVALIIFIDTFKNSIELIFPNIDLVMTSLYETLKDIILFIKDLF